MKSILKSSSDHGAMSAREDQLQQEMIAKQDEILRLQERVNSLSQQLHSALYNSNPQFPSSNNGSATKKTATMLNPHAVQVSTNNKRAIGVRQERLGRNASITTQSVLDAIQHSSVLSSSSLGNSSKSSSSRSGGGSSGPIARVFEMFTCPASHMEYLTSSLFAKDILKLCSKNRALLEKEPRVVFVQSPAYVFGDVHGNVEDLHFFADNIWRLGMECTAGRFLFLGDYVDRGLSCLECIAYLMALKYTLPQKVYLLRGNHETRDVNGWEEHYGDRSFIAQCQRRFGPDVGYRVWEACNSVFDRLPLAGVIDGDIFCVHGGIPRPVSATTTRIQDILTVPKVAGINPPYQHEDMTYQQVASDCIWSDPATEEQELTTVDPQTGFGSSLRGGGAICFGNKAVTDFLAQHNFSYILRAHEAHAEGVAVSKGARVFTVFSTSKDHNQGSSALAGCILVDNEKLQVINRSPAYKNQYVHRRDSVALASLPADEIQQRMRLGLVRQSSNQGFPVQQPPSQQQDEELRDWQDFESEDDPDGAIPIEDYEYDNDNNSNNSRSKDDTNTSKEESDEDMGGVVHQNHHRKYRRSSIDLSTLSGNVHDDLATAGVSSDPNSMLHEYLKHGGSVDSSNNKRSKRPSVSAIPEDSVKDIEFE